VTFSSYFSLSALASYITQNWEKLLFPFLMGVHADRAIGLYGQAFGLMIKPVFLLTAPLVGVMVPALARVRGDSQKFADTAARFFRLASIGLLPCAVGLTVVAPDFMLVIAGPKWIDAGPILAALSPAIFAFGLLSLSHFLFAAVGRAGLLLIHSSLFCLLVGQGFFVGYFAGREAWPVVEMGSMVGIAIAFSVVTTCVWLLPSLWFTFRVTGMPVGLVARQVGPVVRPALLMGLVVWALRQLLLGVETVDVRARLVLVVAAGVGLFALLARREMRWFFTEWVQLRRSGGPSDREAPGRSESHSPNR
jgi:O-antigen/teichoic acid export membrane protein